MLPVSPCDVIVKSAPSHVAMAEHWMGRRALVPVPLSSQADRVKVSVPMLVVFRYGHLYALTNAHTEAESRSALSLLSVAPSLSSMTVCVAKICENGGTQDSSTCDCVCPPEYTGELCGGKVFTL